MTIGEYLAAARKAHEDYRRNIPHMRHNVGKGKAEIVAGDATKSIDAMKEALRLRTEADTQDPNHLDPAWGDDKALGYRQESLTTWYSEVLARGDSQKEG